MIKLNLTSNEFIAINNELAKMIDMQPVSKERCIALFVRQYHNFFNTQGYLNDYSSYRIYNHDS
jgi:hypothetical protein